VCILHTAISTRHKELDMKIKTKVRGGRPNGFCL